MLFTYLGRGGYVWTPFLALSPWSAVMQGFRHEIWQIS